MIQAPYRPYRYRFGAPIMSLCHGSVHFRALSHASVLFDSMNGVPGEKEGKGSMRSLGAFEVIDDMKRQFEALCPGLVACADILALAARDAIVVMGGGAIRGVARGRRDGVQFLASEANTDLPPPLPDYDSVVSMLAEKGLNARDMDLLSGSHTVEKENCAVMQSGLDSHGPEIAPRFC